MTYWELQNFTDSLFQLFLLWFSQWNTILLGTKRRDAYFGSRWTKGIKKRMNYYFIPESRTEALPRSRYIPYSGYYLRRVLCQWLSWTLAKLCCFHYPYSWKSTSYWHCGHYVQIIYRATLVHKFPVVAQVTTNLIA